MTDDLVLWAETTNSEVRVKGDVDLIATSPIETRFTQRGLISGYDMTIRHKGLVETRHIFGRDLDLFAA